MSARAAARLAWTLWMLSVMLVLCSVFLLAVNLTANEVDSSYWITNDWLNLAVASLAFSTVGAFIASRQRENIIGWLFCAAGLLYGIAVFAGEYVTYVLLADPGSLPGGVVAVWFASWLWVPSGSLILCSFLVFPNGRLPSPRWRFIALLALLAVCLATLSFALMPGTLEGAPGSLPISNPFGVQGATDLLGMVRAVSMPLLGITALASVAAIFLRFHRARGDERQQLKWIAYAVVVLAVAIIPSSLSTAIDRSLFGRMLFLAAFLAIPVAFGVAILRYRLYDIDVLINRTLVYGLLTASLAAVYVGIVVVLQGLLRALTGQESQLAIVASTLAIAALFNPLRRRVQAFVDRRFYRRKYDAAKTLEAFSAKLRDETNLDTLSDDVVGVIRETMQPAHVSLWLRPETPRKSA